jgi:hypothetical protein
MSSYYNHLPAILRFERLKGTIAKQHNNIHASTGLVDALPELLHVHVCACGIHPVL